MIFHFLLSAGLNDVLSSRSEAQLSIDQRAEVFETMWTEVRDRFYDPGFRGVDWLQVKQDLKPLIENPNEPIDGVLRDALLRLRNSHLGILTPADRKFWKHTLPFCFERCGERVFASYLFPGKTAELETGVEYGDEILAVDSKPARSLRNPSVTFLSSFAENPYYGARASRPVVRLRRSGSEREVVVKRVHRFGDISAAALTFPDKRVAQLRFLKLDRRTVPPSILHPMLEEASRSAALILDFRDCVGGDRATHAEIAGMLLGWNVELSHRQDEIMKV
jgi:C-terminal processing protease CtpA/Prc